MRKSMITGTAVALSLAVAGTAQADTVTTNFDGFTETSVNGQFGWKSTGNYDQAVVDVGGNKALRVSNARTSGSFGDMTFSNPVTKAAGENEATNVLVNEFTFRAPDNFVPGLIVSISPDAGDGSRMSYLRLEDQADGVHVIFNDDSGSREIDVLSRTGAHTIKFETTFVHGHDNDVVRVIIDGNQKVRGGSWENYYRFEEERNPSPSDRLLIRTAGTAAPATLGSGFLFDDVTSTSYHVDNPAPLHPVVIPQGPKGDKGTDGTNGTNGTNGTDGKDGVNGVTTVIHDRGPVTGASLRTVHASKIKGLKFVSVRAKLRGKSLPTYGRSVKVDLRGKSVGNYIVRMTSKYKKGGKIYKVRSIRSLNIVRK